MDDDVGLASRVRPAVGATDWFAGRVDNATSTLVAPLRRPAPGGGRLDFRLWYDTEAGYDRLTLESTPDGATFTALPFALSTAGHHWATDGTVSGWSGRRWLSAAADLPAGTTALRWRYTTDPSDQGRGVYLDGIRAHGATGLLFDGETRADAARIVADGWTVATT
jgi:bacillopeptidase F (M6 metalloprotease family)